MPGKVNPVIPEVVCQVSAQVIGNDTAITVGGLQGNFELNVQIPLIARNLLQSIGLLTSASRLFATRCIDGIEANVAGAKRSGESTLVISTALNPYIGYDRVAAIVKDAVASGRSLREVALEHGVEESVLDEALDLRKIAAGNQGSRVRLMDVLVLQHIACEPPGEFEDVLRERGASIHRVELDEGEPLPQGRSFDAIVAMGGPMSVNDETELPWLVAEKQLIREAVESGVPYWGSCLGVQLLASSLGARVYAGGAPEVGVLDVELTDEGRADPVFAGLPASFPTLQWHGDTFDLPAGAHSAGVLSAYPNQAFRYGRSAYGVQFHVEVSGAMAEEWGTIPAYVEYADRTLGEGGIDRLLDEFSDQREAMLGHARSMFEAWVEHAVAVPR